MKQDPSLLYRLLRYLNSPVLGLRSEVHSSATRSPCSAKKIPPLGLHLRCGLADERQVAGPDSHRPDSRLLLRGFFRPCRPQRTEFHAVPDWDCFLALRCPLDRPMRVVWIRSPFPGTKNRSLGGANIGRRISASLSHGARRLAAPHHLRRPSWLPRGLHRRLLPATPYKKPPTSAPSPAVSHLHTASPVSVFRENVIFLLHARVAREPALGVVPLWWLVVQVAGRNILVAGSYSNAP